MKKYFSIILSAVFAVLLLSGCSCDHEYTSTVTKEATYKAEGEVTYVCSKCGDTYTEAVEKLTKHVIPTSTLDAAVSKAKYYASPFSISVGKLVNSAMDNYKITYFTGEEAISKGYLSKSEIDSSVDINNVYFAVISGETMLNPDLPYMTEYEEEAVQVWMIFDENDVLQNSGVALCSSLENCAIMIMASSY